MVKSNSLRATKSIGRRGLQTLLRIDRDVGADEADAGVRVHLLDPLGRLRVGSEGRRGGVHDHEVAALKLRDDVLRTSAVRRRVDQL